MFHWYEKKQGSEFDNKWHCHSPRVRDAGSDGLGVLQSLGFIGEGTPRCTSRLITAAVWR